MVRAAAAKSSSFDAQQHITDLRGSQYLEVKWRLVWLRFEHPDAELTTTLMGHEPQKYAVFSCTINIPGGGSATGWGSETQADFKDYLEKAETKAIGRACAALGYGTQFSGFDFDVPLPDGTPQIVDAPVKNPEVAKRAKPTPEPKTPTPQPAPEVAPQVESREELLAACVREQARLGADQLLEWMAKNTKDEASNPKTKRSQMTDDDLRRLLAWAQTVS